jgi:hypothetical protein
MFISIGTDSFDSEVLMEKRPVLLACISRDYDYDEQTRALGGVSKRYGTKLKVCLLDEDSIGAFMKFGIEGSPAFIIFHEGEEKGRMLGKADPQSLSTFVLKTLTGHNWGKK